MKFKIVAKLEISDHDGWCSGGECEYTHTIKNYIVNIPDEEYYDGINLINFLPTPEINTWGSYYCDLSDESKKNNLSNHDYKYTIVKAVILDNQNKKENL